MGVTDRESLPVVTGVSTGNETKVIGTSEVGGEDTLLIADMTSRDLLEGILIELKKLNLRQESAFEETVNDGDITC